MELLPPEARESIKSVIELTKSEINALNQQLNEKLKSPDAVANIKNILRQIGCNYKFEIFSKPTASGMLIEEEKTNILNLIENTEYIDRYKMNAGISVSPDSQLIIMHSADYINKVISEEIKKTIFLITGNCKTIINNSENFGTLKILLKSYEEQLDRIINSKNRKEFLSNLSKVESEIDNFQEIKIWTGYLKFFKKINENVSYNIDHWVSTIKITNQELSRLLTLTYNFKHEINSSLEVIGVYISLSEVMKLINNDQIVNIKLIKICAFNTIFFDEDMISSKLQGTDLIIVAPNWRINENKIINLHGKKGDKHNQNKAQDGEKPEQQPDNSLGLPGNSGQDGLPGNPGNNGGNFFGLSKVFDHSEYLTVDVSGGKGGPGQNGGNGSNGNYSTKDGSQTEAQEVKEKTQVLRSMYAGLTEVTKREYLSQGSKGGVGGDGGKSGEGGEAGYPGQVKIISDSKVEIKLIQANEKGDNGIGGLGGIGGKNGTDYTDIRECTETFSSTQSKLLGGGLILGASILTGGIGAIAGLGGIAALTTGVVAGAATGAASTTAAVVTLKNINDNINHQNSQILNTSKAPDGNQPLENNYLGMELPIEPTPITGLSVYLKECNKNYYKHLEITPNFVDQSFLDLVTNLIGED